MSKVAPEVLEIAEKLRTLRGADDARDRRDVREFWARPAQKIFKPNAIRYPHEYQGGQHLSVSCTQTDLPKREQRDLVQSWCEKLPTLSEVRWLWFNTKTSQELFEAACRLPKLESLYVNWSSISDLAPLQGVKGLRYLKIGSFNKVEDISPIEVLDELAWLVFGNLGAVRSLEPIASRESLVGLGLTGKESGRLVLESFDPLAKLTSLEWLHLGAITTNDLSLRAFHRLSKLRYLGLANYFPTEEFARLSDHVSSTVCDRAQPFQRLHSSVLPCRRCQQNWLVACSGKGARSLCPTCDSIELAKHVVRFNAATSAESNS